MSISDRKQKLTDVKKDTIVDGMEKALLSKSYEHLTIDDVAKEAEYSKKTIYSYFKSKDEIYLKLLIRKFDLLFAALKSAIAGNKQSGIEKIGQLGKAYYRFAQEYPEYMQSIINYEANGTDECNENDRIIADFNAETEKSFLLLEEVLKEGVTDGSISADIDVVSTAILFWCINGFVMLTNKKGNYIRSNYGKPLDVLLENNMDMLLRSLSP